MFSIARTIAEHKVNINLSITKIKHHTVFCWLNESILGNHNAILFKIYRSELLPTCCFYSLGMLKAQIRKC